MYDIIISMKTPYFLWDYDLTDAQIHTILTGKNEVEKKWLIARILSHAHYKDVFKYMTVDDIVRSFPKLSLPSTVKTAWQRALRVWGYNV